MYITVEIWNYKTLWSDETNTREAYVKGPAF
jgi:hypothetical protein